MTNLTIPDTREAKFGLIFDLAKRASKMLPPVYVISHKRAGDVPTLQTLPWINENGYLVVAEDAAMEYELLHPEARILEIPSGYAGLEIGIGRAKQFVLDHARENGDEHIILLDDDLESLSALYSIGGGKVSHAYARLVEDKREEFYLGLLVLFAAVMDEAYAEEPTAVTGSPQRNNSNRTTGSASARWELNRGVHPSQMQSWHVGRFWSMLPEGLNLEDFNYHGEDIAVALDILAAGGSLVTVPSIIGQYRDYETESTLRTPETAPALRQKEHEDLQKHALWPYVRTRLDLLDRPQWHAIDWRKIKKERGVPEDKVLWIE